jgi:hypothetical protein
MPADELVDDCLVQPPGSDFSFGLVQDAAQVDHCVCEFPAGPFCMPALA